MLPTNSQKPRVCSVPACGSKHNAKGLCKNHYARMKRLGSATAPKPKAWDRSGDKNPRWKGGVIGDGHGRILVYAPNHPYPNWCGTHVYQYRIVVEKHLGRYLMPDEVVHHINGIKDDDRIENLKVLSQSEHINLHRLEGTL